LIWLETRNQADADRRRMAMWGTVVSETPEGGLHGQVNGEGLYEGGRFWADAIKDTYDDPGRRLAMAKRNLPLPAAFREAAIALRAIIRAKRKLGEPFEAELLELHQLAAIASLAPYDPLDITPYAKIAELDLSPTRIGWDALLLLNKTDRALMADVWRAPGQHVSGEAIYPQVRRHGEQAVRRHNDEMLQNALAQVDAMPPPRFAEAATDEPPRSFWSRLLGL
jgi:hypothetical protein